MGIETALILGAAAASTAVATSSAKKQSRAAEAQSAANRAAAGEASAVSQQAFDDVSDIVEGVGFDRVDIGSLQPQAFDFTADAQAVIREELLLNRDQAIGESNLDSFESLKQRLFKESEFNFDDDVNQLISNSALSRADASGVVGLSERIATDQRLQFGGVSRGQLSNLLNFETQFTPQPLNPLNTLERLANFEFQQNQFATNTELAKAGLLTNAVNNNAAGQINAIETIAANDPSAIGFTNDANQQAVLAQGISTVGNAAAGAFGNYQTFQAQQQSLAIQKKNSDIYRNAVASGSSASAPPLPPSFESTSRSTSPSAISSLRF